MASKDQEFYVDEVRPGIFTVRMAPQEEYDYFNGEPSDSYQWILEILKNALVELLRSQDPEMVKAGSERILGLASELRRGDDLEIDRVGLDGIESTWRESGETETARYVADARAALERVFR